MINAIININLNGLFSHYSITHYFFGNNMKKCVSCESVSSISSTQSFFVEYKPQYDTILF